MKTIQQLYTEKRGGFRDYAPELFAAGLVGGGAATGALTGPKEDRVGRGISGAAGAVGGGLAGMTAGGVLGGLLVGRRGDRMRKLIAAAGGLLGSYAGARAVAGTYSTLKGTASKIDKEQS